MMDFIEEIQETTDFILEPISVQHSKPLFELLQAEELYTFIPTEAPQNLNALKTKFEKWQKRYSADKKEIWLNYAILSKKERIYKGTLQATIIENTKIYIAYEVFPEFWKRGIAKECVSKLISILFHEFNSLKIKAHVDTRNISSIKLLESLKFDRGKTIKDADFFKGQKSDEFVYELDKKSWIKY